MVTFVVVGILPLPRRLRGSAGSQLHANRLIDRMTAAHPDVANPYTLGVAAHDLLATRT